MKRDERRQAVAALRAMAVRFDDAAGRAFTLEDEDQRHKDAATIRMVAVMVSAFRPKGQAVDTEFVQLWLSAGERMLDYYDSADMDAVYASRLAARDQRAAEAGR
ncbi:hypothetical protein [Leifsonia sp. WHRI 6310E]|uniref:hypothetical protein n=1 Tax=Leifsonia sp. WHRI 6310E TaxID=3162562 RepID=UPI0032EE3EED